MPTQPASPSRSEIKPRVDRVLNAACATHNLPTHPEPIGDGKDLFFDLGLGENIQQALAIAYTQISVDYQGGKPVSQTSARACETVGNAVSLVHARANGQPAP
jgi:hypothetical protein